MKNPIKKKQISFVKIIEEGEKVAKLFFELYEKNKEKMKKK